MSEIARKMTVVASSVVGYRNCVLTITSRRLGVDSVKVTYFAKPGYSAR
jgi:hypothetical protein